MSIKLDFKNAPMNINPFSAKNNKPSMNLGEALTQQLTMNSQATLPKCCKDINIG